MTDRELLHRVLGRAGPDPGCERCFDVMDQAVEAQVAGEDLSLRFPEVAAHVHDCAACREDLVALRAYVQGMDERPEPR